MRRKEVIFVGVIAISALLIVAAETASNKELIGDDEEKEIQATELPKKISSDDEFADADEEQKIATTESQKKNPFDEEFADVDEEQVIATTELPKKNLEVTCAPPPEIEGSLPPQIDRNKYRVGEHVAYSCNYGYVSRNSRNHISTCIVNETTGRVEWTVPEIACIPRSCGDPGYVNNGRRIGNLFTFPNKIEFQCEDGYNLVGMKSRYCQAGGEWSGRLPACEPIFCNVPLSPVNGEVSYPSLEYGTELTYKCQLGYMKTHNEPRYCDEGGTWSGVAPECIETRCTMPDAPENGKVHIVGEPKVGSIAAFSCNAGLKLHGASTTKCLISGQWTFDKPQCLSSCSVPLVENGEYFKISVRQITRWRKEEISTTLSDGENVEHNESLLFHCKEDFAIVEGGKILKDGRVNVICYDGKWSKDLHCNKTSCLDDPPRIENGEAQIGNRSHNHTIWYKCDNPSDKKISGNVTCHFGTWIGIPPKCVSLNLQQRRPTSVLPLKINKEDKAPPPSSHRDLPIQNPEQCHCTYVGAGYNVQAFVDNKKLKDGDKVIIGKTVNFSCRGRGILTWRNGFRTYGNVSMTCTTCRKWEVADNPDCKVVEWGGPVIYLDRSEIQPGGAVEVPIENPITLTCTSTYHYPQWFFGEKPVEIRNFYSRRSGNTAHLFSDIHINEIGYDDAGLYTCHLNTPTLKRAVIDVRVKTNECPSLATNQLVTYSNGNKIGSWATFSCPENTLLVGDAQILCQNDGTWSSPEPNCRAIVCTLFPTAEDLGVRYSDDNQVGSRATFYCRRQTTLVGSATSDCRNNGTWSSPAPNCRAIVCTLFPTVEDLGVRYSDDNQVGSRATFYCRRQTTLVGSATSDCRNDGTWSSPAPYCTINKCHLDSLSLIFKEGDMIIPDMRDVTDEFVPLGSTVPLTCEEKFVPEGNSTAVCGEEGKWKIGKFECISGCRLNIEQSSHLQVQPLKDSYRFGEQVVLSCPDGEKMADDLERLMCLGQLTWSDKFPDCIKK